MEVIEIRHLHDCKRNTICEGMHHVRSSVHDTENIVNTNLLSSINSTKVKRIRLDDYKALSALKNKFQ